MAAATGSSSHSYGPQGPYLSPQQQDLLLAALSSQRKNPPGDFSSSFGSPSNASSHTNGLSQIHGLSPGQLASDEVPRGVDPSMLNSVIRDSDFETPRRFTSPGRATLGSNLWADFDANGGFNFDTIKDEVTTDGQNFDWTGNSSSPEQEGREKRKSHDSDDEDDEDDEDQPATKTPNGKVSKKPGRKPLTSEPTTKRKAQNRAAQRAFRERKEKHLRDLEQKVDDLEQLSASANHENGLLKAKISRMQKELEDYRKRLSAVSSVLNGSSTNSFSSFAQSQSTDFNFEFPRFGSPVGMSNYELSNTPATANPRQNSGSNGATQTMSNGSAGRSSMSPRSYTVESPSSLNGALQTKRGTMDSSGRKGSSDAGFGNGNSPDIWRSTSGMSGINDQNGTNSQQLSPLAWSGYATSHVDSPPHLMTPHNGSSSSCATSPEPSQHHQGANADGSKMQTGISSIANNNSINSSNPVQPYPVTSQISEAEIDFSNLDWLGHQNYQFDPLLFGDYRESQDAVVGTAEFGSGLYDDAFDQFNTFSDFNAAQINKTKAPSPSTPLPPNNANNNNMATSTSAAATTKKTNLIEQVDRQKEGTYEEQNAATAAAAAAAAAVAVAEAEARSADETSPPKSLKHCPQMMSAKTIWSHLKTNPQFQSGQIDIDSLCSELSMKATCSETGMAIPKNVVEKVLWRLATDKDADKGNGSSRAGASGSGGPTASTN